ncbi:hypothetical protein [Chryseobacterium indoltheticum]|jgi:hypothetical protein|uniref:hypothetical protein n=1 Tax=Chryseobacterium indoltheticum TaxID=254 RepID=UPI00242F0BDC|nr:hypothetical protein [Chryseobacterium indoltheticum]MDF2832142.1 hypothetical protein [Chryseobacterium indoltheticum]
MANTIHLISKEYLNPNEVSNTIEKVAQKLSYDVGKSYSQEYDIIEINLFKEGIEDYLSISINCRPNHFNDTFNNLYNIAEYGIMVSIDYGYEDILLIPFLRQILIEIPELLVYSEETPKGIGSYVFNISHLENSSGTDSYALLGNPPKDLSNLA